MLLTAAQIDPQCVPYGIACEPQALRVLPLNTYVLLVWKHSTRVGRLIATHNNNPWLSPLLEWGGSERFVNSNGLVQVTPLTDQVALSYAPVGSQVEVVIQYRGFRTRKAVVIEHLKRRVRVQFSYPAPSNAPQERDLYVSQLLA